MEKVKTAHPKISVRKTAWARRQVFLLRLRDLSGKLKDPPHDRHHFCFAFINLYTFLQLVQANLYSSLQKVIYLNIVIAYCSRFSISI